MMYNEDEFDWSGRNYQLTENNFMGLLLTGHTWRTITGLAIVFVIGGVQALHGGSWGSYADMALPVLLALEHIFAGKTE